MCILLYDDRVKTYHRMREIAVLLDDLPELAYEMVINDVQNRQAHKELSAFNDTHQFVFVHPFTIKNESYTSEYEELLKLKRDNPIGFLNEITNVTQNIRRIESQIRQKKYKTPSILEGWKLNLEKAKTRLNIMSSLIKE